MKVYIQYEVQGKFNEVTWTEKDGLMGAAPTPTGMMVILSRKDSEHHRFYGNLIYAEVTYEHESEPSLIVPDNPGLIVASA